MPYNFGGHAYQTYFVQVFVTTLLTTITKLTKVTIYVLAILHIWALLYFFFRLFIWTRYQVEDSKFLPTFLPSLPATSFSFKVISDNFRFHTRYKVLLPNWNGTFGLVKIFRRFYLVKLRGRYPKIFACHAYQAPPAYDKILNCHIWQFNSSNIRPLFF